MPAPRPQRLVRSAGALVWRFADPTRVAVPGEPIDPADIEVLMVHRPRYHDWSWPKGKAENGEPLVAAAVREVEEETGQVITLGVPLTTQRYRLGGGQTKEVHYWVGTPLPADDPATRLRAPVARAPRTEIDQTTWATPEAAAHPADPPLGRFGVRQSFDLIDLLSAFGVGRAFASPSARAAQVLAPWAAVGGGSVTLVEALGMPVGDEAGADKDADGRAGRVRAFAAQRLREQAGATLLSVTGAARDLIVEEIRAYGSSAIVGASPVSLGHGQIMVAHVEQGSDGPVVVAVETHSVTTKNPAVPTRKASRRH